MDDVERRLGTAETTDTFASDHPGTSEPEPRGREAARFSKLLWLEAQPTHRLDLLSAIELMQEAALVLAATEVGPRHYRIRYANERAVNALGVGTRDVSTCTLDELLPADTAAALSSLCDWVVRSRRPVEHFAAAPDALTDLTGMPTTVVRVTQVGDWLLCTWVPGWHRVGDEEDRNRGTIAGTPVADRLELAAAVDALGANGFGVFSFDMTNGRLVMSSGMYRMLGIERRDPVVDVADLKSFVEFGPEFVRAWQALIKHAVPMDTDVRLVPGLGDRMVRVLACASLGHDHHPVVVRGCCRLREN
jgi:PAS domain-containing protein